MPYEPVVQAFRGLIRQLLGESETVVALWRDKLLRSLGNVAGVIAALIPEIRPLLGADVIVEEELPTRKRWLRKG